MSPQPDQRSPIALATEWVARLTVVGVEMVLIGLGGVWLDKRLKTEPLLALVGFAVGIGIGIFHLLVMTSPGRNEDKRAGNSSRREDAQGPRDPSGNEIDE